MRTTETIPILARKLTPRYIATLIGAAFGILVVGFAIRPAKPVSRAVAPPSQSEMQRLQGMAERQSLETMTHYFASIAEDVAPAIVRVGPASSSGIAWSPELVVGAGQRQPMPESTTLLAANGEPLAALRVVGGPDLPLAAFQVSSPLASVSQRASDAPELTPGQWLVAVWRGDVGEVFAPGHYVETRIARCGELAVREVASSLELSASMAGAGLFDLDGALVAVVLPCEGRYTALHPESVSLGLDQGRTADGRLRARYGLRVIPLAEVVRTYIHAESGVMVSQVWTGFAGDLAGLRPGDVIVGVDGNQVASPDDLQRLLAPRERGEAVLGVWRARRSIEIRLLPRVVEAPRSREPDGGPGLGLAPPAEGFPIGPLVPGSPAAVAGIREGDQLLRVDLVAPRSPAEAARALSRKGQPIFVEIRRGALRFGLLLG